LYSRSQIRQIGSRKPEVFSGREAVLPTREKKEDDPVNNIASSWDYEVLLI